MNALSDEEIGKLRKMIAAYDRKCVREEEQFRLEAELANFPEEVGYDS